MQPTQVRSTDSNKDVGGIDEEILKESNRVEIEAAQALIPTEDGVSNPELSEEEMKLKGFVASERKNTLTYFQMCVLQDITIIYLFIAKLGLLSKRSPKRVTSCPTGHSDKVLKMLQQCY